MRRSSGDKRNIYGDSQARDEEKGCLEMVEGILIDTNKCFIFRSKEKTQAKTTGAFVHWMTWHHDGGTS